MADMQAANYARPKIMNVDGRAAFIWDRVSVTSLAAADTMSWRVPAGAEVCTLQLNCDQVESTTASLFRVGYLKFKSVDTLTPNDAYFAAAGQTTLRAGGVLTCRFVPIKFDVEWILQLLLNTGGTLQAGGFVTAIAGVNMNGSPS
jgi:hypothetical protein